MTMVTIVKNGKGNNAIQNMNDNKESLSNNDRVCIKWCCNPLNSGSNENNTQAQIGSRKRFLQASTTSSNDESIKGNANHDMNSNIMIGSCSNKYCCQYAFLQANEKTTAAAKNSTVKSAIGRRMKN